MDYRPLLTEKEFIGSNNLILYFRKIYLIWYKGFPEIIKEQVYNLFTYTSICILVNLLLPFMKIPCILFFIWQCIYTINYLYTFKQLVNLNIYTETWEETCFNLIQLQDKYQFCRIKPILEERDIKEYILFYDKFMSSMIKNKIIPFPNIIHFKIYHHVIIDYFLPFGRKCETDKTNSQTSKRFILFGLFYIFLFPFCFLIIFWNLMKYFEMTYSSKTKEYEWSNYAIYYYRDNNEYLHETIQRLYVLNDHAYNIIHFNDKKWIYTILRIISFISGNILFYLSTFILYENDTYLIRWIGVFGIIIGFCQKWISTRVDDITEDCQIVANKLNDLQITKTKFSKFYINNFNMVIQEIISFFQTIWYFVWIYPSYTGIIKNFFNTETEFYFPVGDIKS